MTSPVTPFEFRKFLEFEKLNISGSNYLTWYNNFIGLLDTMSLLYVIQTPLGEAHALNASQEEIDVYKTHTVYYNRVKYGIILSLET